MIELSTQRLILRPFLLDDVDDLHALWADREVRRYLFSGEVPARRRAVEIVEHSIEGFALSGYGFFSVRLDNDPGRLIGFTGFRPFEQASQGGSGVAGVAGGGEVELLFAIAPSYWGRGYATEATRRALRHGFEECGIGRVVATTDTPNQRSVRVLQRLGLFFDQRRERHGLDTVYFAMTAEEFAALDVSREASETRVGDVGIAE